MDKRKILIIGHNPISKSDNVGITMGNIFSKYKKEELCQIYLREGEPDFSICDQYYFFNEVGILKSLFNKKASTGYVVTEPCSIEEPVKEEEVKPAGKFKSMIYELGRSRTELIYLMRNILWTLGKWDSPKLRLWLRNQKPTCIFFFAGDYFFLFKIVEKIADLLNIPVYVYHVDEYYFTKKIRQFIGIDARIYRKHFEKMYDRAKATFCISEFMTDEYSKYFKKKTELLMNTSDNVMDDKISDGKVLKMSYFGNLSYHRWENLSLISSAVRILNEKYDRKIIFEIYSGEKSQVILKPFLKNPDVNFKGRITPYEVKEKMIDSDILVHVESFNKDSIIWVKHSISTKVPDMLASRRLIFAVGPDDVSCINYFQKYKTGMVYNTNNLDELVENMKSLYETEDFSEYKNNAMKLYNTNHYPDRVREILDQYF